MDTYFGDVVTVGVLTTLIVEVVKLIVRKFKPEYDFPVEFYALVVPVLNALMPFVLVFLGLSSNDPILSFTLVDVIRYIVLTLVASAVSFFGYNGARIVTGKQIGRASCRERVCQYV